VRAGIVISGVGAYNTYTKLMPQEQAGAARAELESLPQSMAAATAYVGLSKDPRTLGFGGENRWLFSSYDHEATWQRRNELVEGKAHFCYLSFPSLKSDHAQAHTAELMAPVDAAPFARWSAGRWRRRGDDYDAIKRRIGDALVDMVESAYPGFRDCVAFMEVATPLTAQHFTGHKEGAIYGLAGVPERYQSKFARIHTPLAGLLLTGSDAAGHGVVGATMGGLMTASAVLGPTSNFIKLLADMDRFSASLRTSAQPMPSALAQAKRLQ
jgi:phytoene dehydrogenase-like protein